MLSFIKLLSFLFFFMGCCVGVEVDDGPGFGAKRSRFSLDVSPAAPAEISFGNFDESVFRHTFEIPLPARDSVQEESPYDKFCREKDELLAAINNAASEDKRLHVVAFDFDGVLTTNPRPLNEINFGDHGSDLYKELIASGATVLITSARFNQQEIIDALREKKDVQFTETLQTETVKGFEFTHADTVVSACVTGNIFFGRASKFEAALLYCWKKEIKEVLSMTLIDDQSQNIDPFTELHSGKLFSVVYPKPKGIVFPPYSSFPDKQES